MIPTLRTWREFDEVLRMASRDNCTIFASCRRRSVAKPRSLERRPKQGMSRLRHLAPRPAIGAFHSPGPSIYGVCAPENPVTKRLWFRTLKANWGQIWPLRMPNFRQWNGFWEQRWSASSRPRIRSNPNRAMMPTSHAQGDF